jgi:hypothetical protein
LKKERPTYELVLRGKKDDPVWRFDFRLTMVQFKAFAAALPNGANEIRTKETDSEVTIYDESHEILTITYEMLKCLIRAETAKTK